MWPANRLMSLDAFAAMAITPMSSRFINHPHAESKGAIPSYIMAR